MYLQGEKPDIKFINFIKIKVMEKGKKCCSCEADFKNEIKELVNEVDGYTKEDHAKKQAEVKAAFAKKDDERKK